MANKLLKSITFPDLTDKYIVGDTTLSVAGAGADAKATGDALATKANIDGSYEDLTAGTANQINTSVRANDKTPYIFRTSGGSVDIGDREYISSIVGGTVAWNQKRHESINTVTTDGITTSYSNGKFSITNNSRTSNYGSGSTRGEIGDTAVQGHKYIAFGNSNKSIAGVTVSYNDSGNLQQVFNINTVFSVGDVSATLPNFYLRITSGYDFVTTHPIDDVTEFTLNIIDLTQMFGSTIADYIYSLETATAGAGVAWFKKLFNKPYYAYNAGELKSVSGLVSHDMTGFNQWDEEWEVGYLDNSTGQSVSGSSTIRSKNYIPVNPSMGYYFKSPNGVFVYFYDADKNFVGVHGGGTRIVNNAITLGSNVYYIRFSAPSEYGTTYKNDICINISWDGSRNGEYEPYVKHSYPLDSDLTLRGIPKLDADNKLYYDGDTYESDGTVTRRFGYVDTTDTTTFNPNMCGYGTTASGVPYLDLGLLADAAIDTRATSNKYVWNPHSVTGASGMVKTYIHSLTVYNSAFTSVATALEILANEGATFVYELATPTTETADPYQQTEIVSDFGTEEFVIDDDVFAIPVGHNTDYPVNLVAKLEMAPNSPDGDGTYVVKQTNGTNEYVPLIIPSGIPAVPSENGSYTLTATVTDGTTTLSWS